MTKKIDTPTKGTFLKLVKAERPAQLEIPFGSRTSMFVVNDRVSAESKRQDAERRILEFASRLPDW